MPLWRKDLGYDRRHGGGILAMGCLVILVPTLIAGVSLSLLVWLESPDFHSDLTTIWSFPTTIWELFRYVATLILFIFSCFISKAHYDIYLEPKVLPHNNLKRSAKLFGIATTFALVVAPLFGITILTAMWSFGFKSVELLQLFGWVSITFYSFSLHSFITSIIFQDDDSTLDNLALSSIGFVLFFFVIGFLISLFATMPPWYLVLTSSLIG